VKYAAGKPLTILPGMEITSREEIHVLAIFDKMEALFGLQSLIYDHLPGENNEDAFGCQAIVNEFDEVEGINPRLLIGATELSLPMIVDRVHELGGLAIAAHIDRGSFSVLSQLGFLDPDTHFDALELSSATGIAGGRKRYPDFADYALIQSSDAHFIKDIGRAFTSISMKSATISELKMAFERNGGRAILE
jgi:PHP family Zn ribbon phosphoesterase